MGLKEKLMALCASGSKFLSFALDILLFLMTIWDIFAPLIVEQPSASTGHTNFVYLIGIVVGLRRIIRLVQIALDKFLKEKNNL